MPGADPDIRNARRHSFGEESRPCEGIRCAGRQCSTARTFVRPPASPLSGSTRVRSHPSSPETARRAAPQSPSPSHPAVQGISREIWSACSSQSLDVARALWIRQPPHACSPARTLAAQAAFAALPGSLAAPGIVLTAPSLGNPPVPGREGKTRSCSIRLLRRVGAECRRLKPARPQSVTNAPCVIRVYVDIESRCVPDRRCCDPAHWRACLLRPGRSVRRIVSRLLFTSRPFSMPRDAMR